MADVSKINGYNVKDANAQAEIENIKNGKTIVQNARVALNANTATNYDTAGGTIKDKFTDHESKINNHQVEINNIKNGTTTVGKANNANTAAAATQANNYNTSTGTIKSKFDELEEKIGSGGTPTNMMTTDTVQDVTGQKKFGDYKLVMNDHADFVANDIDIYSEPNNDKHVYFNGKDKYGRMMGAIGFFQNTHGDTGAYLQANYGDRWGGNLGIRTKEGTSDVYAFAPNPPFDSKSDQIATTYWVRNKLAYRQSLYSSTSVTTGQKSILSIINFDLLLFVIKIGSERFPFLVPKTELMARNSSTNKLSLEANSAGTNRFMNLYFVSVQALYFVNVSAIEGLEIYGF